MLRYSSPVEVLEYKAVGNNWEVSGYPSVFGNEDLGRDVVLPGAYSRTLQDGHKVRFLYSHDPTRILGVPKMLRQDKKGLFGTFAISKTRLGEEAYTLLKDGALDSFSIGYIAEDWEHQGQVRQLKSVNLVEVSLVAMPMNPQAMVTDVKSFDLTWAQKASGLRFELDELSTELSRFAQKSQSLTDTKRQELMELLETFSGLDAVRSDLQSLLAAQPLSAQSMAVRMDLLRRKLANRGLV